MDSPKDEVECPVCDSRIAADAKRCPNCGADFSLSGLDEAEQVARDLNGKADKKAEAGREPAPEGTAATADKKKEGILGRLFRKKR